MSTIKIDRSFVAGVGDDAENTAIVTAITAMARALGVSTVAEGVETAGQVRVLQELGCDVGQGFLFAPPQPAAVVADQFDVEFLAARRAR